MPNTSKILVLYGQPNLMKNIFDTVTGKIAKKMTAKVVPKTCHRRLHPETLLYLASMKQTQKKKIFKVSKLFLVRSIFSG